MHGLEELIKREVKQVFGNRNFILRDEIAFIQIDETKHLKINSDEFIVLYKFQISNKEDRKKIEIENETDLKAIKNEFFINSRQLAYFIVCHTDTKIYSEFEQTLIKYFRVQIM